MRTLLFAAITLITVMMICTGCNKADTGIQPYEYTASGETSRVEFFENDRIKEAGLTEVMTLEQLGHSDIELTGGSMESRPVTYTLPDDATQGPDEWYILNFHFLIEFEETTGGGFCNVGASPAGSVELETMRVNDAPFVRVGGQSVTTTSIEVHYHSYMGLNNIKPGKNEMTFKYREYEGAKVKRVMVYKDTGISVTATAPSAYEEAQRITAEEKEKAREIAFKDERVREMTEGKEYAERITRAYGDIRPADAPPDDDIEIRLIFAGTYKIEDIEASGLDIFIDLEEETVTDVFPLGPHGMPELTASEKDRAIKIALSNADVRKLLEGKIYEVTRVGISQGGPVGRVGANMDIDFGEAYQFTGEFPYLVTESKYLDQALDGIEVFINLKDERVVQIWPNIVMKP